MLKPLARPHRALGNRSPRLVVPRPRVADRVDTSRQRVLTGWNSRSKWPISGAPAGAAKIMGPRDHMTSGSNHATEEPCQPTTATCAPRLRSSSDRPSMIGGDTGLCGEQSAARVVETPFVGDGCQEWRRREGVTNVAWKNGRSGAALCDRREAGAIAYPRNRGASGCLAAARPRRGTAPRRNVRSASPPPRPCAM